MGLYFDQSYSLFLVLASLIVAGIISYIAYRNKQQQALYTSLQRNLLTGLRFLSVFLLLLLLLEPVIRHYTQNRHQPVLVFAVDNSESLENFKAETEEFVRQSGNDLDNYNIDFWTFGEEARKNDTLSFNEVRSDYSSLLRSVSESYLLSDIGSMVIVGDGIYNTGDDPVYESRQLPFPVYTIGVGDTISHMDAAIRNVNTNNTSFLDNYFPVEVDLSFTKADGNTTKLSILKDGETVYESNIPIYGEEYFKQEVISLKAEDEGINNYSIVLENLPGEENTANNQYDFSINVVSEKQKILFLTHGSHPDISAIIQSIEDNNNYEWEIQTVSSSPVNFNDYDLVIVHQLPDDTRESIDELEQLKQSRIPFLVLIGSETSLAYLSNLQLGIQIQQTRNTENATPILNPAFSIFTLDNNLSEQISLWPPVSVPFGNVNMDDGLEALVNQRIQTIETSYPLISTGRIDGVKKGFIIGEGIWRWRLYNYLQDGSHEVFDGIIQKLINYLVQKPNEDNFNVYYETNYAEDIPVTMEAELFNDSYELVNDPDVTIEITSQDSTNYSFVFDKKDDQYELDMGNLPPGTYSFVAKTSLGETEYEETGSFQVSEVQIEQAENTANFQVLYQMALNTGGDFFTLSDSGKLKDILDNNRRLDEQRIRQLIYQDFISMKWAFLVILLIVSVEWFLRKFWGSY